MVPVQAQEQVTTQQETIFGHTIDVMIIDSECLDEQLCHAWRPLHLIEYYGADWCEPCLDVELSLENIDTTKYAVIQHHPSVLDSSYLNFSNQRYETDFRLIFIPSIVIDGEGLLTGTKQANELNQNLPNNQTAVFNGTMQLINYDGKTAPYTKYNPNTDKSCWNSFIGIDRKTFKVVAAESWNFGKLLYDSSINKGSNPEIKKEKTNLDKYYFEYFITQVGAAPFRGSGVSVKKGANNSGNDGMAYRVYGCGINTGSPTLIVTLESLVILPK